MNASTIGIPAKRCHPQHDWALPGLVCESRDEAGGGGSPVCCFFPAVLVLFIVAAGYDK